MNSQVFTAMVWAYHTGGVTDAYQDIISLRDSTIGAGDSDDQVIGLGTKNVGGVRVMNVGDVDTDVDGVQTIPDNEWHHFALTGELTPNSTSPPQRTRLTGYLDGIQVVRSSDTELTPPTFPDNDCWLQLFNSRSSETDVGSVFVGHMAGLKVWSNVALTPAEIFCEMWSYMPVRTKDIFCVTPMQNEAMSKFNYMGLIDFTVQGSDFADGVLDPPGVSWDAPMIRRLSDWFVTQGPRFILGTH